MQKNELGALILRLVLGITFFGHGLVKFQGGIGNTVGWFDSIGVPGFLAYIVAFIELVGGIAIILGIGTRIVSGLLAIILLGAIFTAKLSIGFLAVGGYELDLALFAMALYFVLAGPSSYSLDHKLFNKEANQAA
jgi:putative oxidoreductase